VSLSCIFLFLRLQANSFLLLAWTLSLPPVRVVRYVDQPCVVLVHPSCVLPVEGRVLQPPALVLLLRCTLACLEGASPLPSLHVDVSRDDSFILGAHGPIRAYGMSVTYRYLSQCREPVFLSGRSLRRAFWSVLYTRCYSDLFIPVLLASLGRRDVLSLLSICLIRGLLLRHDYLALIKGWLVRHNCPALGQHVLSDCLCFSGKIFMDVVRMSYFRGCLYYYSIRSALFRESVLGRKPLSRPKLEPTCPSSSQDAHVLERALSSERCRGGGNTFLSPT